MATNNFERQTFGRAGCVYIGGSGSSLTTPMGKYVAVTFVQDSVLSSSTIMSVFDATSGTLFTDTFEAGITIYGSFDRVTLTSGSALVYAEAE